MPSVISRLIVTLLGVNLLVCGAGCRREEKPVASRPVVLPSAPLLVQEPLPLNLSLEQRREALLKSLWKRVLGRLEAKEDVERVATLVRPLLESAVNLPDVQPVLQKMAQAQGLSLEEQKKQWADWQEADIFLESGGRDDAVSSAQAVGVAQWLAGTAHGVGLKVNLAESRRLSEKIREQNYRYRWDEYNTQHTNTPNPSRQQALAELESLRAKRREADERYDLAKAINAQTRYLLRLYGRYPSPEWVFQAYHGGEAGVARTLKLYGSSPDFESLYFDLTPKTNLSAFLYLYGRSDDHRYYWWKIRVAHEILELFRKDKQAFQAEWEALLPGRSKGVLWYPSAHKEALPTSLAVQKAVQVGRLVSVKPSATITIAKEAEEPFLRPETKGLLDWVVQVYRENGGTVPLLLVSATLPQDLAVKQHADYVAKHPPKPNPFPLPPTSPVFVPKGDVAPADFNLSTTGLAFQIRATSDTTQRRILDYALSTLSDKNGLWYYKDREANAFTVLPNPCFRESLKEYKAENPPLANLSPSQNR